MIEIRDQKSVDLRALQQLRRRCAFAAKPLDYLGRQVEGSYHVVHAYDAERLVGFARAISDGVSCAYLSSVMVDPDYRRRGIGRALIAELLRDNDGIKFVLQARPDAVAFWAANGFAGAADVLIRDRR